VLRDTLLPEFDQEMAATRRLLERAPAAAFGWRPHEKSWTLGGLATHLSQIPHWGTAILTRDAYDIVTDGTGPTPDKTTPAEVLAVFDAHVAEVRQALAGMIDGQLLAPWSLSRGGHVLMSMPRSTALRRFLLSHLVHHRGQFTVYLRLQNVSLPPIYGPTADEGL
jgi:uncharacterized damage-inducible protein DinB